MPILRLPKWSRVKTSWIRRGVAAALNTVLLATFMVVPIMDGVAAEYGAVIESEHGACSYVRIHDHAICVQFGSNAPHESPGRVGLPPAPPLRHVDHTSTLERPARNAPQLQPRTRAPPQI